MRRFAILYAFLLILCSLLIFSQMEMGKAEPRSIVVPDDYTSIQRAISVAGEVIPYKSRREFIMKMWESINVYL